MSAPQKRVAALPVPLVGPHEHITEIPFMEQLRRAISAAGRTTRIFRTNVGSVPLRNRAGQDVGRFNAGPVVGASDLQGLASVTLATTSGPLLAALALAVEVKVDAPVSEAQQAYVNFVNRMGGVGLIVKYDHALSLEANVVRGVSMVDEAIAARLSPLT